MNDDMLSEHAALAMQIRRGATDTDDPPCDGRARVVCAVHNLTWHVVRGTITPDVKRRVGRILGAWKSTSLCYMSCVSVIDRPWGVAARNKLSATFSYSGTDSARPSGGTIVVSGETEASECIPFMTLWVTAMAECGVHVAMTNLKRSSVVFSGMLDGPINRLALWMCTAGSRYTPSFPGVYVSTDNLDVFGGNGCGAPVVDPASTSSPVLSVFEGRYALTGATGEADARRRLDAWLPYINIFKDDGRVDDGRGVFRSHVQVLNSCGPGKDVDRVLRSSASPVVHHATSLVERAVSRGYKRRRWSDES